MICKSAFPPTCATDGRCWWDEGLCVEIDGGGSFKLMSQEAADDSKRLHGRLADRLHFHGRLDEVHCVNAILVPVALEVFVKTARPILREG
jgi:hypothetical protein